MHKHKNIPFFIPHSGCPNNCVFCSQTKITGYCKPAGEIAEEAQRLRTTVEESLPYINGAGTQIAFFGGSFTGIEPERMITLLQTAYEYVKDGRVESIRLSTRPDYIDPSVLSVLKSYGVKDIELGMQSTDSTVLAASGRGHDRDVCFQSAALIVNGGFNLGGQMMIGLPFSDAEKELQTARDIIAMGATSARIYPAVVFSGTKLYDMVLSGEYRPLTNEDAVRRSADCCKLFNAAGVDILRIGLHASPELAQAPYGANHPAMGELVYSALAYDEIAALLDGQNVQGKRLYIYAPQGRLSAVAGHRGCNKTKLCAEYGMKDIKIYKSNDDKITVKIEAED